MYGWIVDGISSLFEPLAGQKLTECPVEEGARSSSTRGGNNGRAAKRSYHSIDINESVYTSEVEAKRRKRDVVLSFVKKTVARVAGLLRLRRPVKNSYQHSQYEDTQLVAPMGIDELHTSCITKSDWIMDKPGGANNPFKTASPPLMRKHSGGGSLHDRDRRGSLQLLQSRSALRLGSSTVDPVSSSYGHNRCYKPNLTVEETIRQNNKEHYRRLLEMVSEKYSKNQPLPFNQSKPQDELSSKTEHTTTHKPFGPKKTGQTMGPAVFTRRNQTPRGRWCAANFSNSFSGPVEDAQHAQSTKKQSADVDLSTEMATRLNLVEKAPPSAVCLPEPYSAHSAHVRYTEEDVPRLSKEMAAEVSSALSQRDPNLVLSAAFKLRITQRDLATLQEGGWLNDEVINFYLSLVMDRSSGGGLRVYSFSTFFFPKLQGLGGGQSGGHAAVKRWTKAVDLFLCDLILVPLHLGVHWALAVIDLKSKTVKTYDSMGQRHDDVCKLLLFYIQEEHKVKKGRDLDVSKWTVCSMRPSEIPQQKNGSDCGVFACKYADYIARERPLTFKQCHVPLFRKLMIWEILHQKLL
ncbi:sentrin-specific protease 2 isoform X2 [Periophthalmus magnuspinnatus]|uniref:sentrin-specific protease 2 isoform X2 n=1 Tax=Periophthalmus magnuspinnatus TaxID=409849 RepID=UPI00145A2B98|nr:sentrin-specific protease 2 isoform X2 [Periophthalmus magnuspinnatus]